MPYTRHILTRELNESDIESLKNFAAKYKLAFSDTNILEGNKFDLSLMRRYNMRDQGRIRLMVEKYVVMPEYLKDEKFKVLVSDDLNVIINNLKKILLKEKLQK